MQYHIEFLDDLNTIVRMRVCLTLRACRDHFESLTLGKNTRIWRRALVRRYPARNIPGATQFSRALSVVLSEFEFLTSTQSEADPIKCHYENT